MPTHDPQSVIRMLREHLAAHDRRLSFLFGAGTSSAVNIAPEAAPGARRGYVPLIPAVEVMTARCKAAVRSMSTEHATAWDLLVAECVHFELASDIESILSRLRLKVDAAGPNEQPLGLNREQLASLEQTLKDTIAALASPTEETIPTQVPHDAFASWVKHAQRRFPIEIFTTNYDVLIERSLERAKTPFFDGFVGSYRPYFSPDSMESESSIPGKNWTRLWKIHGSTNWTLTNGVATRLSNTGSGDMILPSHRKYDESRKMPYLALMDRLTRTLSTEGTLLVTSGYSWSDQHINATILTALDTHPTNAAVALIYTELDTVKDLVEIAKKRKNLIVVGPSSGVIRGELLEWALPQALDSATASFLDISFDSNAMPDPSDAPISGKMRLGDFNCFCRLLASMTQRVGAA